MAKIGLCLSGCGVNDGAEIHESVITALALDQAGTNIIYTAPNVMQTKVVDHYSGNDTNESRNVLIESARIARGDITDLARNCSRACILDKCTSIIGRPASVKASLRDIP